MKDREDSFWASSRVRNHNLRWVRLLYVTQNAEALHVRTLVQANAVDIEKDNVVISISQLSEVPDLWPALEVIAITFEEHLSW